MDTMTGRGFPRYEEFQRLVMEHRRLSATVQRVRRLVLVASGGLCALVLLLGATELHERLTCKELVTERISVVDAEGKEIVALGVGELGYGLAVYNKEGEKVVMLGVADDGANGGIVIQDRQARARIGLGIADEIPSLVFVDEQGRKVAALGVGKNRHGLVLLDADGAERVAMAMTDSGPTVCVMDEGERVLADLCPGGR